MLKVGNRFLLVPRPPHESWRALGTLGCVGVGPKLTTPQVETAIMAMHAKLATPAPQRAMATSAQPPEEAVIEEDGQEEDAAEMMVQIVGEEDIVALAKNGPAKSAVRTLRPSSSPAGMTRGARSAGALLGGNSRPGTSQSGRGAAPRPGRPATAAAVGQSLPTIASRPGTASPSLSNSASLPQRLGTAQRACSSICSRAGVGIIPGFPSRVSSSRCAGKPCAPCQRAPPAHTCTTHSARPHFPRADGCDCGR